MLITCESQTRSYDISVINRVDFTKDILEACADTQQITFTNLQHWWVFQKCSELISNPDVDCVIEDNTSLDTIYERLRAVYFLLNYENILFGKLVKMLVAAIPANEWSKYAVRSLVYDCIGGKKSYFYVAKLFPNDPLILQDQYKNGEKGVDFSWMLSLKSTPTAKIPIMSWSG